MKKIAIALLFTLCLATYGYAENSAQYLERIGMAEFECDINQVFVHPRLWAKMPYRQKEKTAYFMMKRCGNNYIYVMDSLSGKKMAEYKERVGFKNQ